MLQIICQKLLLDNFNFYNILTGLNWGRGNGIQTKYLSTKAARCAMQLQQEVLHFIFVYLSEKRTFLIFHLGSIDTFYFHTLIQHRKYLRFRERKLTFSEKQQFSKF
jgi:hypothetical protein